MDDTAGTAAQATALTMTRTRTIAETTQAAPAATPKMASERTTPTGATSAGATSAQAAEATPSGATPQAGGAAPKAGGTAPKAGGTAPTPPRPPRQQRPTGQTRPPTNKRTGGRTEDVFHESPCNLVNKIEYVGVWIGQPLICFGKR